MGNCIPTHREQQIYAAMPSRVQPVASPPVAPNLSYDELVVAEANRRIEEEKRREIALAEKKRFEDDVAEQVALAKNPGHMTRAMVNEESIVRHLEAQARDMEAKLREQERQKKAEIRMNKNMEKRLQAKKRHDETLENRRQAAEKMKQEAIRSHEQRMKKIDDERIKRAEEEAQKKREEEVRKAQEEAERLQIIKDADDYIDNTLNNGMYSYKNVASHELECAKMDLFKNRMYEIARKHFFENSEDPKVFRTIAEHMTRVWRGSQYDIDESGTNQTRAYVVGKIVECGEFAAVGVSKTWGRGQHEWNYKWLRHHHLSYCGYCKSCPFGRDTTPFG
jgi:hypothetical protein